MLKFCSKNKMSLALISFLGFWLLSLSFMAPRVQADKDKKGEKGPKIKIKINADQHHHEEDDKDDDELEIKDEKFEVKGLVAAVSGNQVTVNSLTAILDPSQVAKFEQTGTPQVGSYAKIEGLIINGNFFATEAKFSALSSPSPTPAGVEVKGNKFKFRGPVEASDSGLLASGQTLVFDPSQTDHFYANIHGPFDATATTKIKGKVASDGAWLVEKIKVHPAPFGVVGATISQIVTVIFDALSNLFGFNPPAPSPTLSPSPSLMPSPTASPSASPAPTP